jgi:hypothetical protein
MKIQLSTKATDALIALHKSAPQTVSITHFLNLLITDYQQLKEASHKEDHNYDNSSDQTKA